MRDEDDLIDAVKIRSSTQSLPVPVTEQQMRRAERRMGFRLPSLLRRLYMEVSNGEFGPGFLPLIFKGGYRAQYWPRSVVAGYCEMRNSPPFRDVFADEEEPLVGWPEKLLLTCDWGCSIFVCIDCSQPELPVFREDCNFSQSMLAVESPSLADFLERWLRGESVACHLDWDDAQKAPLQSLQLWIPDT